MLRGFGTFHRRRDQEIDLVVACADQDTDQVAVLGDGFEETRVVPVPSIVNVVPQDREIGAVPGFGDSNGGGDCASVQMG